MFDILLGGKFSGKCKYAIKCIESRVEPIRKKKQAMLRFLRKDVADLLASGYDSNALGRVDVLIVETNHASCYDKIVQYCECISKQLPNLQKQRECPREVMEAVSTLIFAAARFPDLPELCDLRRVFTERYGTHMESSVNTEFVEKIQKKSFLVGKQLCLMQEIADEYSINWDFKKFGNKISSPTIPSDNLKKMRVENDKLSPKLPNGRDGGVINVPHQEMHYRERGEPMVRNMMKKWQPEPKDVHVISNVNYGCAHDSSKKTKKVFADESENMKPFYNDPVLPLNVKSKDRQNGTHKDETNEVFIHDRSSKVQQERSHNAVERQTNGSFEPLNDRAAYMAPPYTKSKGSSKGTHAAEKPDNGLPQHKLLRVEEWLDPSSQEKQPNRPVNLDYGKQINMIPPYVKPKVSSVAAPIDCPMLSESSTRGPFGAGYDMSSGGRGNLDDGFFGDDEKPRPRSVRKKHTKLPPKFVDDDAIDNSKHVRETLHNRRRQGSRQTTVTHDDDCNEQMVMDQQIREPPVDELDNAIHYGKLLCQAPSDRWRQRGSSRTSAIHEDDRHDEEKIMDRLLIHYSKKGMLSRPSSKTKTVYTGPPANNGVTGVQVLEHQSKNKKNLELAELLYQRAISLPPEAISSEGIVRGPTRAASMQPDLLSPNMEPVYSKLPDYEELAVRFSALRKA